MHIGIIPHSNPSHGGSYQYSLTLLDALNGMRRCKEEDRYTLFVHSKRERGCLNSYGDVWRQVRFPLSNRERLIDLIETSVGEGLMRDAIKRAANRLSAGRLTDPDRIWSNDPSQRFLKHYGIDWVLYVTPHTQSFEGGLPYVMPVYDLQHRLQPEFREVSASGEWERREYLYRNGTRYATLIVADSEVGKEDILEYYSPYGVTSDRVKVLPYRPAPYLSDHVSDYERGRVRKAYRLPERYLFYPAHLWPHKNHVRIVQAIGRLKDDKKSEVHLVLCGAHSGAIRTHLFREMKSEAHRLGVERQIHYLGYVANADMSALYGEAVGLVMPTFFGPTNIPIVEAWLFGCPVLTSDIRGIREQVGDAGLLVDPRSVEAIADGIRQLWEDEGLRAELARRGTRRLATHTHEDFCTRLGQIIEEANQRVAKRSLSTDHPMMSA